MINGICNTWVGNLKLYANDARFERNNKVTGYKCVQEQKVGFHLMFRTLGVEERCRTLILSRG